MKNGELKSWEEVVAGGELPLILVRHGQTDGNVQRRFIGRVDLPLNETGKRQARALGERFEGTPWGGIYTSPLARAKSTAEALGEAREVNALQELDQGVLEGKTLEELPGDFTEFFAAWDRDAENTRVPGGETLGECRDRAWGAMREIAERHAGESGPVAIVAHQMVISVLLLEVLEAPLKLNDKVQQKNTGVSLVGYREGRFQLHWSGDTSHLD